MYVNINLQKIMCVQCLHTHKIMILYKQKG